ncbi:MAG: M1 family aminopeptidase [Pirellulaceae bacterium]
MSAALFAGISEQPTAAQDRRGPFTTAPRSIRTREVDQQHIRLDLRFDLDAQAIDGRATIRFAPFKPLKTLTLDAAEMKIVDVERLPNEGEPVALKHRSRKQQLEIDLDRELAFGETTTIAIRYEVRQPRHGAHFVIPDKHEPDQPKMVWTQSEPEYARYWYPCFDSPNDRLTSEIVATAPAGLFVLSNGSLANTTDNGDGTKTWHWTQQQTHVPYLMSVVVGDFEAYEQKWGEVPVTSYVPRGRLADAPRSFEKTPGMMQFFSQKIGVAYPWPKYAQICVDEYNWGGMEHTSATTLNLSTLHDARAHLDVSSVNLVAHELAHQWFGDLLTCKDWGELWLNESFATYFANLWTEHDEGWNEATWDGQGDTDSYLGESKRYVRPIVSYQYNEPSNMFDRHSYPKGGRVLHMLRFVLGDERFWRAINHYVTVNQHRTVETADLRIAIEESTGETLNWFFDQWIYHAGHPQFHVAWRWDEAAGQVTVTVKQTQKVDETTPLFRTPVEIELAWGTESQVKRIEVSKAEETFHFPADRRPSRVCFDPNNWILKELTAEQSKEELLDQLTNDEHVMCRVRAVAALKPFAKDDDVAAALATTLKQDPFWGVRQEAAKTLREETGDVPRRALIEALAVDTKAQVRRAAAASLARYPHDDSRAALRTAIGGDRSYFVVAEALRSLLKIDRDRCEPTFLDQLPLDSEREVVLKAACDGLVELKSTTAAEQLAAMLAGSISPQRRVTILAALARLKPDDGTIIERLHEQIGNGRRDVRRAAIDAIVEIGDPAALDTLRQRRDREESLYVIREFDEAIEKLEAKRTEFDSLRKETESLRKKNRELEERLKKLEAALSTS